MNFNWGRGGKSDGDVNTHTSPTDGASDKIPDELSTPTSELVSWAFLYSDVCHEVLPVTSGTRITVAYDVWHLGKHAPLHPNDLEVAANPIKDYLVSLLRDTTHFMPAGGRIAFGTCHEYPVDEDMSLGHIMDSFKGKDAVLMAILAELQLETKIRAVYDAEDDPTPDSSVDGGADANEESNVVTVGTVGERYALITGSCFYAVQDAYLEDYVAHELKRSKAAGYEKDVIWITQPGGYGHSNTYVAYGNEVSGQ